MTPHAHWIDSHIHLSSYPDSSLSSIFVKAEKANIKSWLMAGYNSRDWGLQKKINHSGVRRSFGIHPWQVLASTHEELNLQFQELTEQISYADAMGETGLDAFRCKEPEQMRLQEEMFLQHLELNKTYQKPMVLHIVKAHEPALSILKSYNYRGLVHGYSGNWEFAQKYIQLGYKISIGRGVYARGYKSLKDVVAKISLDDLLLESDAVFDPEAEDPVAIFSDVVRAVCAMKGISESTLMRAHFKNYQELFEAPKND